MARSAVFSFFPFMQLVNLAVLMFNDIQSTRLSLYESVLWLLEYVLRICVSYFDVMLCRSIMLLLFMVFTFSGLVRTVMEP